jgi:hypothetical protein
MENLITQVVLMKINKKYHCDNFALCQKLKDSRREDKRFWAEW